MGRVTREQWETALHRLRRAADAGGPLSAEVAATAAALGVTERTVWRRLGSPPSSRSSFALSQTDIDAFSDFYGNVAAVHRARSAAVAGQSTAAGVQIDPELVAGWADAKPVDLRTLQRAFERELTPAFMAGAKGRGAARRAKLVYLEREATFRNPVWEGDHKCVPIVVLPPRGRAVAPWLTMFIDDATRVITGWAIGLTPPHRHRADLAADGDARSAAYGVAHGVPSLLRLDQGLEFAAAAVTTATSALGTETAQMPGYHPHLKGKIERAFLTVDQMLLSSLPGYTGGPRRLNGALDGPVDDRLAAREHYGQAAATGQSSGLPLGLETFARIFGDWVKAYNTQHVHSELGRTPQEAWLEDPTPLVDVPEEQLRHLLLAGAPRKSAASGIRFRNLHWVDPGGLIRERRGQRVQIRYMPYDDRQIHVYLGGEFLATCLPRGAMTEEQEEEFYAAARAPGEAGRRGTQRRPQPRPPQAGNAVGRDGRRRQRAADPGGRGRPAGRVDPAAAAAAPPADLRREASTACWGCARSGPSSRSTWPTWTYARKDAPGDATVKPPAVRGSEPGRGRTPKAGPPRGPDHLHPSVAARPARGHRHRRLPGGRGHPRQRGTGQDVRGADLHAGPGRLDRAAGGTRGGHRVLHAKADHAAESPTPSTWR